MPDTAETATLAECESATVKLVDWRPGLIAVGGAPVDERPLVMLILGDQQIGLTPLAARTIARTMIAMADLIQGRET